MNHRCALIGFHSRFGKHPKNWDYYSTWEVFQKGSAKSIHLNNEKQGEGERESDKALLGSNVTGTDPNPSRPLMQWIQDLD
jgi:hypothetical protein